MENNWILKNDELPSAYEEVEVLMTNGDIHRDMIIRGKYGNLEWRNWKDRKIKAWREINQQNRNFIEGREKYEYIYTLWYKDD